MRTDKNDCACFTCGMNAIIGFTNIALRHPTEPEVKCCLEKIGESSDHLLTLINDVLDISRIESGKC